MEFNFEKMADRINPWLRAIVAGIAIRNFMAKQQAEQSAFQSRLSDDLIRQIEMNDLEIYRITKDGRMREDTKRARIEKLEASTTRNLMELTRRDPRKVKAILCSRNVVALRV